MTPALAWREPMTVLGVARLVARGTESPDLFAHIWKVFESRQEEIRRVAIGARYFGVSFPTADVNVTDYLAGMEIPSSTPCPEGLEVRSMTGGSYAVFECPVDAIGATYQHVFGTWLPGATVQFDAGRPSFEEYPEDVSRDPVRIWIPVREATCC
jgi:predicted transcriptional regulator YdeE